MGWTCSSEGKTRNACRILVRKPVENWQTGRPRKKWKFNIREVMRIGGGTSPGSCRV
jgi:hypothetical protein